MALAADIVLLLVVGGWWLLWCVCGGGGRVWSVVGQKRHEGTRARHPSSSTQVHKRLASPRCAACVPLVACARLELRFAQAASPLGGGNPDKGTPPSDRRSPSCIIIHHESMCVIRDHSKSLTPRPRRPCASFSLCGDSWRGWQGGAPSQKGARQKKPTAMPNNGCLRWSSHTPQHPNTPNTTTTPRPTRRHRHARITACE